MRAVRARRFVEALRALRGDAVSATIDKATPDDLVMVTFAGHGMTTASERFALVFSEFDGSDPDAKGAPGILDDVAFSRELGGVDAGELVVVVDACQSGAVIDGGGFKPGPLGAKGFGQMAYDKRARVLAAAQADDAAIEDGEKGHGLLTYALTVEGLGKRMAADAQSGTTTLSGWLSFGARRVPILADQLLNGTLVARGVKLAHLPTRRNKSAQVPRLFDGGLAPSTIVLAAP